MEAPIINNPSQLHSLSVFSVFLFIFSQGPYTVSYFVSGIFPVYVSKRDVKHVTNLLLLSDDNGNNHYVLILDLDCLLRKKTGFKNGNKHCPRCLVGFSDEVRLEVHQKDCENFSIQRVLMPEKPTVKFESFQTTMQHLAVIYCDFESCLVKSDISKTSKTRFESEHVASGFAMKVVSRIKGLTKPTSVFRGPGSELRFVRDLLREYEHLKSYLETDIDMVMTLEDEEVYRSSSNCGLCGNHLDWSSIEVNARPVRHHDHFTGRFICASHSSCNLKAVKPKKIPVVFHGLKNYDCKFLIKALHKFESRIEVIANSSEKFTQIRTKEPTILHLLTRCHILARAWKN